jgi:hypothetical protein
MTESKSSNGNVIAAPLRLARFQSLAEAYGAAIENWPETERAAARALLERSQDARDALADAALLDRLLDTAEPPPPSDPLVNRLERRFEAYHSAPRWMEWLRRIPSNVTFGRPALALAGMAAALLVAVIVHIQSGPEPSPATARLASSPMAEFGDGAFAEDDDTLDLEIALIDQSSFDPSAERLVSNPTGLMGWTVASAPRIEDMPLD